MGEHSHGAKLADRLRRHCAQSGGREYLQYWEFTLRTHSACTQPPPDFLYEGMPLHPSRNWDETSSRDNPESVLLLLPITLSVVVTGSQMPYTKPRLCLSMFVALFFFGCGSNETLTTPPINSGVETGQQSSGSQQSGTALYVGNKLFSDDPGQVSVLHVDARTGALSELTASPFDSMQNIGAFLPIASGKFLLYWNHQFHPTGNSPTTGIPDTSGLYRVHLGPSGEFVGAPVLISNAVNFSTAQNDASEKFVFIENPSGEAIDVFTVNQATGELSLQPGSGVSFSQPIQLLSRTEDKLWIDAGPSDAHKKTYQAINIDSASGKLTLDNRQLTFAFDSDQVNQGYIVTSREGVFVYQRLTSGQELYSIYGEQSSGFARLPGCPAQFASLCSISQPFPSPAGDRVLVATGGKLWSIPFDPATGLQFSRAKSTDIAPTLAFSNMMFSEDGRRVYGIDADTAQIVGFVVEDSGSVTQVPGSAVHPRNNPGGSWTALALGKTVQ